MKTNKSRRTALYNLTPLCACDCGNEVKLGNKFINGHNRKGQDKYAKKKENGPPFCECNCSEKTKWNVANGEYNKYITGHNARVSNPMHKKEVAAKFLGEKNYNYGKLKGRDNPMFGREHPSRGKKIHSEEFRKTQSERVSKLGDNHPMRRPEIIAKISGDNHPMKRPEVVAKISGKNHPFYGKYGSLSSNWKGGIAAEPYCDAWLDKEYKESIKKRDNYECQNPDCWHTCDRLSLCLHHVDYVKKDCTPWNLLTLCKSCNTRANENREYWQKFYQNIISEKNICRKAA